MIHIDFNNNTYQCPFCGHDQAFTNSHGYCFVGLYAQNYAVDVDEIDGPASRVVHWFTCANSNCRKTCITSINRHDDSQHDIYPEIVYMHFPDYIPLAIRADYEEACLILERSPKAAATMFRRCLQGMIRDFHSITKGRLIDEINELQRVVPAAQWDAIDAIRKVGNIGAHMEKDVSQIIDVDVNEAELLRRMIELLMQKWYVARNDEQSLYSSITTVAKTKRT